MKPRVLVVEDEKIMRVTIEDALAAGGYEVTSCDTTAEAFRALDDERFDVIITDVRLPDGLGVGLLEAVGKGGQGQVIVMTAYGTIRDAVEAMKRGAFDYITKPFLLDEFMVLVAKAVEVARLKDENIRLRRELGRCYSFPSIIGESGAMKRVFSLIERVAASDATVLILGESGTGKELVATTIHYQSGRKNRPIIRVNCAALPESLIESELFGHERGAFTGAVKRKPGRFELAHGGTIFLDEIGDIPSATQVKLLRVIQEKTFERVGGTDVLNADVRIIAATNRNIDEEVKKGSFREDLFYRLNVIPIALPPLRARKEDIPSLVEFFLGKLSARNVSGSNARRFTTGAMEALLQYDYPGNVRELENIVERCVTLAPGEEINREDLPATVFGKSEAIRPLSLHDVSAGAEKEYIVRMLVLTKGNRTKTAELLGVSRKTLWEKMNQYGIEKEDA